VTGVVTKGQKPSWKCILTLSGYHTRPIYDVRWSVYNSMLCTFALHKYYIFRSYITIQTVVGISANIKATVSAAETNRQFHWF